MYIQICKVICSPNVFNIPHQIHLRDYFLGGIKVEGVEMGRHVSQSCQTVGMYVLVLLGEGERRRKDEGTYRTVMLSLIKPSNWAHIE